MRTFKDKSRSCKKLDMIDRSLIHSRTITEVKDINLKQLKTLLFKESNPNSNTHQLVECFRSSSFLLQDYNSSRSFLQQNNKNPDNKYQLPICSRSHNSHLVDNRKDIMVSSKKVMNQNKHLSKKPN